MAIQIRDYTLASIAGMTTGAYASGQSIGTNATNQLANLFPANGGSVKVKKITILDLDKQNAHLALVFFNAAPTAQTDKAAYNPTSADLLKVIGVVDIPSTTYEGFSANGAGTLVLGGDGLSMVGVTKNAWVAVVSFGTPNWTVATNLKLIVTAEQQ